MNAKMIRLCCCFLALLLVTSLLPRAAFAAETDEAVQAVIQQLEAIDTLAQMQAKRYTYKAIPDRVNVNTTNTTHLTQHEAARTGYEGYVSEMFAARIAAQQAYDALTDAQKAQVDPALVAKLDTYLPTVFHTDTFSVSPADNEYIFEAVQGGFGQAYEVGSYMISGEIAQTFILVDTSNGEPSWTPSGLYSCGESNYDVVYCCDVLTPLNYGSDYKRLNLEDSGYYGKSAAEHIRAILLNSYPYITMEQMKSSLKAGGLNAAFVDSLTRGDIISAVQMSVWTYANAADGAAGGLGYFASIDIPTNIGGFFTPLHDYTNEIWEWLPGTNGTSYDARAEYRVNTLAYYLCNLPGIPASQNEIVISDIEITRAQLIPGGGDTFSVGMYIHLNNGGLPEDDLNVIVTSSHTNADGSVSITEQYKQCVNGKNILELYIRAKSGDTITVAVDGTQTLGRGVYFYEPEGGRDASQCLVGAGEGRTRVHTEKSFAFIEDIDEMGLRIYKTETGSPLSGISFHIYRVNPGEGEIINPTPTPEEIARYQVPENLVTSLVTDATGYASAALEEGQYLVVEEHDPSRVKSPVDPFYITIPMTITTETADGTTVEVHNILSVYPKNEPVPPPEVPPIIPPVPDNVTGAIQIVKYNTFEPEERLAGAQFTVYRPATSVDEAVLTITSGGIQYAVTPVLINGAPLVMTTGEDGIAVSPELPCGTYYLVETVAPDGFILLTEAAKVTVLSGEISPVTTVEIGNEPGKLLPETGGMGTTVFLVLGSLLTVSALVLLVTKKRMSR